MDTNLLIGFLIVFWAGLYLSVKIINLKEGRKWSEGVSFIPVIPVFPLVAFGAGALLNWMWTYLGTVTVVVAHVAVLSIGIIKEMKRCKGAA
ncbi:hypothetical protein [Cerasicoccus fimbriatus]|uniref:hypothetical protein n=1 Tax=Cerasicoccus fimbriatus TaxID=3014554 RepID=UPI0022B48B3F|nr:hypothetical protein [Cerasicoccus sp. TK19100]